MHSIVTALALAALARASVTPTAPGGGKDVYVAGQECSFEWKPDESGKWESFDVDLYTGHNYMMRNITRVASGLDGTDSSVTKYSYRCPEVVPPAPIYFYQFSLDGEEPTWTQRFAIAAPNGTVVVAPNAQQPNGDEIPWGIGHLANETLENSSLVESITSPESEEDVASAVWGLFDGHEEETAASTNDSQPQSTSSSSSWDDLSASSSVSHQITGFNEGRGCGHDDQCPEEAPCCSEYGYCGTGRNCLAGCNPLASFQTRACVPVPAFVDQKFSFEPSSTSRVLQNSSFWNGDASSLDWVIDSVGNASLGPIITNTSTGESALALSMLPGSVYGTTITSTRSLLYGNVTARIKSAPGKGDVAAFYLISGTEDKINFELTPTSDGSFSTHFSSNGERADLKAQDTQNTTNQLSDTDFHEYTISWLPESITWLVDGVVMRKVSKNATLDRDVYRYPQTPSRIRFWIREREATDSLVSVEELGTGSIDDTSTKSEASFDAISYISSVDVLCYPTSLLSNFTFANSLSSTHNDSSPSLKGTNAADMSAHLNISASLDSALPSTASASLLSPTDSSVSALAFPADLQSTSSLATPTIEGIAGSPSPSSTLWWSSPVVSTALAVTPQEVSPTIGTAQAWGPLRKLRRWIQLEKREEKSLSAYSYGSVDENGQVAVNGYSGSTLISTDRSTGLDMLATAPPEGDKHGAAGSAHSADEVEDEHDEEDGSKSRMQRWEELPTWAKAGIIGGSVLVGLLLVVIIGRCFWRKASGSSTAQTAYAPIGDQGGSEIVTPFSQNNGALYDGSSPPMGQTNAKPTLLQRSSTSSTSATYTNGGYVPSSSLRKQYFPSGSDHV
ncbi:hypothetical protein JCM3765_001040 [Sporobolomyces pararoseus]